MPSIVVAGVRAGDQANDTDDAAGINQAVVQDAAGRMYDVYACDSEEGRKRLQGRVRAAQTLMRAKDPGALGFALDNVLAFADGTNKHGITGGTTVMVATHRDGTARPLSLLTLDDCASVGTAIGAIHRLRSNFLQAESYPVFTTGQIRAQLTAWIKRLQQAGHVPSEITASWSSIIETEGLWSFLTCPVHGGFSDGDILFQGSTITAITNWQDMQVNDPARDLAWIFAKLDNDHRNAVLAAYGRMMGSRLDDLIMLRANLWLQMEQVGDFISALNHADSQKIMQFKAQVERLAHQLGKFTQQTTSTSARSDTHQPSTITVGTLLDANERRRTQAAGTTSARSHSENNGSPSNRATSAQVSAESQAPEAKQPMPSSAADRLADPDDETNETDRTGSADIRTTGRLGQGFTGSTAGAAAGSSSETIVVERLADNTAGSAVSFEPDDKTRDHEPAGAANAPVAQETPTIAIPLLEREERAMRDAQSRLIPSATATVTAQATASVTSPASVTASAVVRGTWSVSESVDSIAQNDIPTQAVPQGNHGQHDDDTADKTPAANASTASTASAAQTGSGTVAGSDSAASNDVDDDTADRTPVATDTGVAEAQANTVRADTASPNVTSPSTADDTDDDTADNTPRA